MKDFIMIGIWVLAYMVFGFVMGSIAIIISTKRLDWIDFGILPIYAWVLLWPFVITAIVLGMVLEKVWENGWDLEKKYRAWLLGKVKK